MTFSVEATAYPFTTMEKRPGGKGRWLQKIESGYNWFRKAKRWHIYDENIIDAETGDVVKECHEPLSEHQGYGDANLIAATPSPWSRRQGRLPCP
jgi:hypothetical protein